MRLSSSRSLSEAPLRFRAARLLLRVLLGAVFRVRVEGLERLPAGAHLFTCNHLSWVDPFLLLGWLPASPRVHFLGRKAAIFNRWWKRWVLNFMGGVIPVASGEVRQLAQEVRVALDRGAVVAIFPEGGMGPREGELQPLRPGVYHFAAAGGVPVVTAGIAGSRELWRGKEIRIRIGETLNVPGSRTDGMAAIDAALRAAMPPYEEPVGRRRWRWLTTLLH